MNKGSSRTDKVIKNLHKKLLRNRFLQWNKMIKEKEVKGAGLEKVIIVKMQRRILKMALKQYRDKVKLCV